MLFVILGLLAGPATGGFVGWLVYGDFSRYEGLDAGDWFGLVMLGVIATLIATPIFGLLGCGIACLIGKLFPKKEGELINERRLVALKDSGSRNGSFFLGSGNINGELVYRYFYTTKIGAIRSAETSAYGVDVYEEDRQDAVLQTLSNEYWGFLYINGGEWREFHVPTGTVQRGFALDLA